MSQSPQEQPGRDWLLFTGNFVAGTLRFQMLGSAENCCDTLSFYIDDELIVTYAGAFWQPVAVDLDAGEHTLTSIRRYIVWLSGRLAPHAADRRYLAALSKKFNLSDQPYILPQRLGRPVDMAKAQTALA